MRVRGLGWLLLLSLVAVPAAAELQARKAAAALTAQEIQDCVGQNLPEDTMVQTMNMVMKDRTGVERLLEAEMFWQRDHATRLSKVLLKFDNPPDLRSAAILVIEKKPANDMFMFLPELGKTRRVTSHTMKGNMMGTDFTYEDFARLQGMVGNVDVEREADEQLAGRAAFVTISRAKAGSTSDYERIRSVIDQETCVPLRVEFFEKGVAEPVKLMTVDPTQLHRVGRGGWMPSEVLMQDVRGGTSTNLVIEKVQVGVPIAKKMFSVTELERHGRFGPGMTRQ